MSLPEDNNASNNRWRFTKDVSLGNLLTIFGLFLLVVTWANTIEKRVVILEEARVNSKQNNARQDNDTLTLKSDIVIQLNSINSKVDRLIYDGAWNNGRNRVQPSDQSFKR